MIVLTLATPVSFIVCKQIVSESNLISYSYTDTMHIQRQVGNIIK